MGRGGGAVTGPRTVLVAAWLLIAQQAAAQERLPCVQLIPSAMTPGQTWTGPALQDQDVAAALTDPVIARLVDQAADMGADPRKLADQLRALLADSPEKAAPAAAASFARLQGMRNDTLAGIRAAAANLRARLDAMDARLDQIQQLPGQDPGRARLVSTQDWDRRVIENGRRLLAGLCERPARIEARFGAVARALSGQ